eukprot:100851_1
MLTMLHQQVEINVKEIIVYYLHELISNDESSPSLYIESSQITRELPTQLHVQSHDIHQNHFCCWHIQNNYINCHFGVKMILENIGFNLFKNPSEFVQPLDISKICSLNGKQIHWFKTNTGINCNFTQMERSHSIMFVPFVKCVEFNLGGRLLEQFDTHNKNEKNPSAMNKSSKRKLQTDCLVEPQNPLKKRKLNV